MRPFLHPGDIGAFAETLAPARRSAPGAPPSLSASARAAAARKQGIHLVPSADGVHTNCLFFLHGYGDGRAGMAKLCADLRLPQTDCFLLEGTEELPLGLGGRGWFHPADLYGGGRALEAAEASGRAKAAEAVAHAITGLGCPAGMTFVVGHGQGAEVAWEMLARFPAAARGGAALVDVPASAVPVGAGGAATLSAGTPVFYRPSAEARQQRQTPPRCAMLDRCAEGAPLVRTLVEWFARHLPQQYVGLEKSEEVVKISNGVVEE